MAIFEKFPYTDLHNLNLDWIIEKVKQWQADFEEYKTELETLEGTVQGLIDTVDQQDDDIQAAIGQLQAALEALPQDIQDEVAEQIGPEVASRIGTEVASQLPAIAAPMVSQSTSDWLEDNMSEPPLDPSMSIRSAVPDAKDCGTIFTYLEDLEISGYERVSRNMVPTIQNDKCWDTAELTGIKTLNGVDAYLIGNIVGGVTYQLDNFYNGASVPSGYAFRAAFIRDYTSGEALDDVVVYHNRTEMEIAGRWNDDETSFRLKAPFGSTALLINQVNARGAVSISELTNEFIGGSSEEINVVVPLTDLNVFSTDYTSITQALRMGGSVYFKFAEDNYNGMTAQVTAYKKNDGNDYSVVMVGPSDKLIKADMIYTSATGGGQLVNVTDVSIGGGGGSTSAIVINLTAGQNSTYTGDIALADLQTFLDNADPIWLSYPGITENNYDLRQVVEYNQDITDDTSLRIGVFSEDEYIVYSVVDDGNDGITLTVVSSTAVGGDTLPTVTNVDVNKGLVVDSNGEWTKSTFPMTTWLSLPLDTGYICLSSTDNRISSLPVDSVTGIGAQTLDLTNVQSSVEQVLAGMRLLAGATVGEPATRYVDMTGATGIALATVLRGTLAQAKSRKKYIKVVIGNNVSTAYYYYFDDSDSSVYTGNLEFTVTEYDTSASKKYVHDIAMAEVSATSARIYVTTTCTNFSSLM